MAKDKRTKTKRAVASDTGRYQVVQMGDAGEDHAVFLLDTQTGEMFWNEKNGKTVFSWERFVQPI